MEFAMHTLKQLEKQQVGLRLHTYLVEEIDELTKEFSVNRTDIIVEAIKSYISEQKANRVYDGLENAFKELQEIRSGKVNYATLDTLDSLIDELEDH
jgi:predicted DNA-binding protein